MGGMLSRSGRMKPKDHDEALRVSRHITDGGGGTKESSGRTQGAVVKGKDEKSTHHHHHHHHHKASGLPKSHLHHQGVWEHPERLVAPANSRTSSGSSGEWQTPQAKQSHPQPYGSPNAKVKTRMIMLDEGMGTFQDEYLAGLSMVQEETRAQYTPVSQSPKARGWQSQESSRKASPLRDESRGLLEGRSGGDSRLNDSPLHALRPSGLSVQQSIQQDWSPAKDRGSGVNSPLSVLDPNINRERSPRRGQGSQGSVPVSPVAWGLAPFAPMSPDSDRRSKHNLLQSFVATSCSNGPSFDGDDGIVDAEEQEVDLSMLASADHTSVQIRTIGRIVRWQRGNLIGSGSYGKVFLGMNIDTGGLFVVKQVVFHGVWTAGAVKDEEVLQLEQEIALLATLQHEHIVQYLGTERNYSTNELSIFLEHMPGGSIADIVLKFGKLQEGVMRKYTREVLSGLKYLHAKGIIHRDIKGQNVLVDNRGVCKLADFGASRYLQTADSTANMSFKGTPVFMSPEVIMEQKYSRKSDIWSLGCTVLQMATGNPPFSEFSNHIAALFHITSSTEPPPVPGSLSDEAREFVLLCFQRDIAKRPFVEELLRHAFVKKSSVPSTPTDMENKDVRLVSAPSSPLARTAYNFAPDLEDETRYKKFKEEQLSRVKITAHIRKTPSLPGEPDDSEGRPRTQSTARAGEDGARNILHALLNEPPSDEGAESQSSHNGSGRNFAAMGVKLESNIKMSGHDVSGDTFERSSGQTSPMLMPTMVGPPALQTGLCYTGKPQSSFTDAFEKGLELPENTQDFRVHGPKKIQDQDEEEPPVQSSLDVAATPLRLDAQDVPSPMNALSVQGVPAILLSAVVENFESGASEQVFESDVMGGTGNRKGSATKDSSLCDSLFTDESCVTVSSVSSQGVNNSAANISV